MGVSLTSAVACLAFVGASTAALAADTFVDAGNIDTAKEGQASLTIVKRESGSNTPGSIYDDTSGSGTPLAGAKFHAYEIDGTDLKTSEGWAKVATLTNLTVDKLAAACAARTADSYAAGAAGEVGNVQEGRETQGTGLDGKTKLSNLSLRAYLVCETTRPEGVLKDATPFIVTLPAPAEKAGSKGWVYDVVTFPKNVKGDAKAEKTVATTLDKFATDAASHTFTIATTVPSISAGESFKYFAFGDSVASALENITVTKVELGAEALGSSDYTSSVVNNLLEVHLTKSGLKKIKEGAGKKLKVTFTADAKDDNATGTLTNTAVVAYDTQAGPTPPENPEDPINPPSPGTNIPDVPNGPKVPTNDVSANWGQFKIKKIDAGTSKSPLQGAEFKVYAVADGNLLNCAGKTGAEAVAIKGNEVGTKQVTTADGTLLVKGLKIDAKNEPETSLAQSRCYVIEETKAPVGYVLPANMNDRVWVVEAKVAEPSETEVKEITNTQTSVPQLPLTGANGQILMIVAGLSLVLFAAGGLMIARRNSSRS